MPIYEYQCENCKRVMTKIQDMKDSNIVLCNNCNNEMRKLISRSSFILVGPGFYENDYKNKK